jgi:hypothetical protein
VKIEPNQVTILTILGEISWLEVSWLELSSLKLSSLEFGQLLAGIALAELAELIKWADGGVRRWLVSILASDNFNEIFRFIIAGLTLVDNAFSE